ncbi:acyl-CoA thioesterase [Thalassorhabdomicrobium marinisediminis]|uniref:Thioesterase n=1 Tax=Thalassorhabdomicrobium marinisediminis TaxID=2170577 RepID=A0A2T7FU99_9RHOB|nr:thioesterase family protein [Thalassorhabdomicrobium marinisediminis]PVA05722.1 hypothetical protein DC363_12905 [Thalassorhabdomicrobium marinisediminis]
MVETDYGLPDSAGLVCWTGQVGPGDIDENGHMNVRSYDRVLEEADMAFFYTMGWTPEYPQVERKGFFRVEKHVRYQSELLLDAPLVATAWLIATDLKRFQLFFQLWHAQTRARAATMETLLLHMDLTSRRPAAMPQGPMAQNWTALQDLQDGVPVPQGIGRKVSFHKQD